MEELNECKVVEGSTKDTRQVQWERIFTDCFLKVDDEVGGKPVQGSPQVDIEEDCIVEPLAPETVGSTAVVAVLSSSHIIVANCGDSRAVLYRGKEAIPLSVDHKVSLRLIAFASCLHCLLFLKPIDFMFSFFV